ncbi:hypothetical protein GCM10009681_54290 [Luedemannella helvata]|uniref:Serine protease n=1 Tax=Luedemannella helvata TaxID=349315 RepID=A0ABP4XFA6_9ACTN
MIALAVLVLTAFGFYQWGAADSPEAAAPAPTPSASATVPPTTAEIYQAVAPSVVSVATTGTDGEASGTGVVVNADASILTAWHVVRDAKSISVTFADGTKAAATVIAQDPTMDIAMLRPDGLPQVLVPAVLGGGLSVGDEVIAIGDQLGLTRTTTTGVVSGLQRSAPGPDGSALKGLIQFDAAVNHGSSGGPLLGAGGAVVGIVVALVNPTKAGTFIGVGFAVPIGSALSAGRGERGPQQ